MDKPTRDYRPLSDYALIGNTHTAALIAPDGAVDWCCLPHFDSPAAFCRLLDAERGGFLRLAPVEPARVSRHYVDGTAVLATELQLAGARLRSLDFMHSERIAESRLGQEEPSYHRLLRRVECLEGRARIALHFRPSFDFARVPARLELRDNVVHASSARELLLLRLSPAPAFELQGDRVAAEFELRAGQVCWMTLSHADVESGPAALASEAPQRLLDATCRHWREWASLCTYDGPYAEQVRASARALKLLTFAPTGALVAAPTTSLPEKLGGVRNWDYRFCWLRDASLVLRALMSIGYRRAAMDFFRWLEGLCTVDGDERCDELQIMHRLDGGRELPEHELPHLAGYRDSRPVRLGNAAAGQVQLDVYGHVLDAALVCLKGMDPPIRPGLTRVLRHLADQAAARWREPDQGLWEARHEPRHFLSSKLMCWVALDRALQLAEDGRLDGDLPRWRREREAVRRLILDHGYNARIGAFTQVIGGDALDASVLLVAHSGLLPARDERMCSTVRRVQERLSARGLVYRYRGDDGVPGDEATFAICSYWLVDNLAMQGRTQEARELFEHVGSFASDLGLMAEEIDAGSGEMLGNYPQGFTHLGLIQSALTIARAESEGEGGRGG